MVNTVFTQFGDSTSGIGALGINGGAFVVQLLTFLVAFLVLRRFAFKPILKVLRDRREVIESGVRLGEEMQKKQTELEEAVAARLHEARVKADEVLAAAHDQARSTVQTAEDKARDKADNILAEAETRIAQDTKLARQKLEGELVGLISEATEAIIDEKVDAKKDAALIGRALKRGGA